MLDKFSVIIKAAQSLKNDFDLSDEKAIKLATKMYNDLEKLIAKYQVK